MPGGAEIRVDALVVGGVDYGEADRVVHLMTPDLGRVSAFARGAKKSKRRFAGALDLFTEVRACLLQRRGAELYTLTAADVVDAHPGIATELRRIACAGYACELARELSREAHENARLYQRLVGFLRAVSVATPDADALCAFELGALEAAGLAPVLDRCARCGDLPGRSPGFDPAAGGVTCPRCTPPGMGAPAQALERLRALAAGQTPGLERAAESQALVRRFAIHHLGRSPKSLRFLAEVGE